MSTAIGVARNWCDRAEVKLNPEKTEVMSIGKRRLKNVKIDEKEIEPKKKLKYLGIVLDQRLTFNDHLEHIKQKAEQLAIRIRSLCWMNDEISLRKKMRIYRSVFRPTMMFGFEVWHQFIKEKKTYIERLQRMQNGVIRIITGAYRATNHQKLLEIVDEENIETELNDTKEANRHAKRERRELKKRMREERGIEKEKSSHYSFVNLDFGSIVRRESIWCLTGTGPFKYHLNRIGKVEDLDCRFCGQSDETSEHLLYECPILNRKITSEIDTYTFENITKELIKELRRRD